MVPNPPILTQNETLPQRCIRGLLSKQARSILYIGSGIFLLLCVIGGFGTFLIPSFISEFSSSLLQSRINEQLKAFGVLSAMKAILGSLEGSSVGVSLGASIQLELGDVVEPFYDLTNTSWHFVVYALLILSLYKIFFDANLYLVGISLLGIALILMGYSSSQTQERGEFLQRSRRLALGGLISSYGFFFAVLLSHWISLYSLEPLAQKERLKISLLHHRLEPIWNEIKTFHEHMSILSPRESFGAVIGKFQVASSVLGEVSTEATYSLITASVITVVELLLLPVLLVILVKGLGARI
jgi:hypothetical protein